MQFIFQHQRRSRHAVAVWCALLVGLLALAQSVQAERIGRVSGNFGDAKLQGKPIGIADVVNNGDKIETGAAGSASVLLDSETVVNIDGDTVVSITEEKGKTSLNLEKGTAQVFLGKRHENDVVALIDPDATIEAIGTVVLSNYVPATRAGYYVVEESFGNLTPKVDAKVSRIDAGKQATTLAGKLVGIENIDRQRLARLLANILDAQRHALLDASNLSRAREASADAARAVQAMVNAGLLPAAGQDQHRGDLLAARAEVNDPINSSLQLEAVTALVSSGVLSGAVNGSTGGFSNVTVDLGTGGTLSFRLFDAGLEDGDQVALRVSQGGTTFLSVDNVPLTNSGTTFNPHVSSGNVQIQVTALNEGSATANTGGVQIINTVTQGQAGQSFNLNQGETGVLQVHGNSSSGGTTHE